MQEIIILKETIRLNKLQQKIGELINIIEETKYNTNEKTKNEIENIYIDLFYYQKHIRERIRQNKKEKISINTIDELLKIL